MQDHNPVQADQTQYDKDSRNCEVHGDPLTYFCLTCNLLVCPECCIHGTHLGHNVQKLTIAHDYVLKDSALLADNLKGEVIELQSRFDIHEQNRRKIIENTRSIKGSMSEAFKEIRKHLDEKEFELLNAADEYMQIETSKLEVVLTELRSSIDDLESTIDLLHIRSEHPDIFVLLKFYEVHKPLMSSIIEKYSEQGEVDEAAMATCELDVTLLTSAISKLQGLHESINSLQGLQRNIRNVPKSVTRDLKMDTVKQTPAAYSSEAAIANLRARRNQRMTAR
ncbi:hypothetical protein PCE1_000851 [Barthelona sp. PCE]